MRRLHRLGGVGGESLCRCQILLRRGTGLRTSWRDQSPTMDNGIDDQRASRSRSVETVCDTNGRLTYGFTGCWSLSIAQR
jgi:hypothetical protein